MILRQIVHAAGRILTRGLLHPKWRDQAPMSRTYLRLYLLGKRITEGRELSTLQSLIAPGMVIADIGANAGFYALEMAHSVGPSGRIVAFEPDPFNFGLLERRARRAPFANVEPHQVALGDEAGPAVLYCSAYNRADNRLGQSHDEPHVEAYAVQVRTLDEFVATNSVPKIDALKIDVQGAEARVLRGAARTIAAGLQWIWLEFSPEHLRGAGVDPVGFLEELSGHGMKMFEVAGAAGLRPVADYAEHTRKMGSDYGDIVLFGHETASRSRETPRGGAWSRE
jgi:FkbM family methyltransferase